MTSTRDRQRAAARARLEREMAERAATAARRRQRGAIIGAVAAAVVVLGLVLWLVLASGGGKPQPAASGSTSPGASASASAAGCVWHPDPNPSAAPAAAPNPNLKDVGTPPASGEPRSGTRDMTIDTNLGQIVIQLDLAKAPCAAASFTYLAGKKFFDGSGCHRLVNKYGGGDQMSGGQASDFHVLQCGDPTGTGQGGPKYKFDTEYVPVDMRPAYPAGVVAMANSGQPGTNGSQFFIVFGDTLLDPSYTIFGKVTKGLDVAQKVGAGGDDGSFEPNPGGGKPKTKLTFTTVTVGPVQK